ncbi:MAG TPA: nuclear transport factor 2 family protein [Candidatus Acidoferrum sp.]|nr:nuclear transport factor 2 family protein [Candidatus Acidoferrum sp.]
MKPLCNLILFVTLNAAIVNTQAADANVMARLQALEDKESIRTLLFDYGRYLDARDWDSFAALFAENGGTWNGGMGVAKGRAAIKKMMIDTIGGTNVGANGSGQSNLHLLGNDIIEVKGDTGTALSKWAFVMTDKVQGPTIMYIGHYQDTFVREKGQWKFKERVAFADITRPGPLPALEEKKPDAKK